MSHGQETITRVYNADPGATDAYRYHDRYVDDTQVTAGFQQVRNGWVAMYDAVGDTWHVTSPSGLYRTYERVK